LTPRVPRDEADLILAELRGRGWTLEAIAEGLDGARLYRGTRSIHAEGLQALRRLLWAPVPGGARRPPRDVEPCTPEVPETPDVAAKRHAAWVEAMRAGLVSALEAAEVRDAGRRRYASIGEVI
jgi:hypothetical protein